MTKPEKLKKILRKEAMEQDLRKKTTNADPHKKALDYRKNEIRKNKIRVSEESREDSIKRPVMTTKKVITMKKN